MSASAPVSGDVFRLLTEQSPNMVFVNRGGRVIYANPCATEVMGYSREEFCADDFDFMALIAPDSRELVEAFFRRHMSGEEVPPYEYGLVTKTGERLDAIMTSRLVEIDGEPAVVGVVTDITERKRAEVALKESQELYRTLLRASPDAVTVSDLEGRITDLSEEAVKLAGCDFPEDLLGRNSLEFIAPEDRERAVANMKRAFVEGVLQGMEYRLLRKDGSSYTGELDAALVRDAAGQPKGFIATVRDITERKRAEEERAKLQEQLRRALSSTEQERNQLALEVASLKSQIKDHYGLDNMIGQDPKMRAVYETILAVAGTRATVLIRGETGTGKELVAKAIHYNSPQRDRPFVKVDCGALTETLLESELFGHVRGAFTGAVRSRQGRFELADTGTILLDDIQSLSSPLQSKLLRVVQDGCFEKVGGTETRSIDVRVIATTNEDPEELVAEGRFRKDLYYRLNVVPIVLPPLRERRGDVPFLAMHFTRIFSERHGKKATGITKGAVDRLAAYDWPGNVRELENIIEQAVVFAQGETIQDEDIRLPEAGVPLNNGPPPPGPVGRGRGRRVSGEAEARAIGDALKRTRGNKKRAAELLGISRSALYGKLKRYGIAL